MDDSKGNGSPTDDKIPLPDLMGMVGSRDDTAGPPTSELSFEDAVGLHPDLGALWKDSRETFNRMAQVNEELSKASEQGLAVPGGPERLARTNMEFARRLDEVLGKLEQENDQVRIEILRTMYQNLCPYWQSLFIQTHMGRAQLRNPGKVHEILLGEATALLDRVRPRV